MVKKNSRANKKKSKKEESLEKSENELNEDNNNNDNDNNQTSSKVYKDIDYEKFAKSIEKELTHKITFSPQKLDIMEAKEGKNSGESLYKKMHNNYIKNNLNINIISMITQLINTSTSLPKNLKNEYPINNILLDIVKELMFTDLEIVYYSLYLDNFGWTNDYYDVKDNLVITALSVKKYLNEDIDIIENHLNKNYEKLEEKFNNWVKLQKNFQKTISVPPMVVNERNSLLKKPFNCYCKNNYIDYNDAVDKILKWSPSYNEINKFSKKNNKNGMGTHEVDLTYGLDDNNPDNEIFKSIPSNIQNNNILIVNSSDNNNIKSKVSMPNLDLSPNVNSNDNLLKEESNFGLGLNFYDQSNDFKNFYKKDSLLLQKQSSNNEDNELRLMKEFSFNSILNKSDLSLHKNISNI